MTTQKIEPEWKSRTVRCAACVHAPAKKGAWCRQGNLYTAGQLRVCPAHVARPEGAQSQAINLWKRLGSLAGLLKDLRLDQDGIAVRFKPDVAPHLKQQVLAQLREMVSQEGKAA